MPGRDAFDELQKANPRHEPAFDAAVAGMIGQAKQVFASGAAAPATVAAAGAGSPWGRRTTTPAGRRRIIGLLLGVCVLVIVLLLLATGTISTLRSHPSKTASPGRGDPGVTTAPGGFAPGGLGGGAGTTTTTTTTTVTTAEAPPTTATTGPSTTSASAVATGATTIGTTRVRSTPTTTRATTPTTVVSDAWPICTVAMVVPPAFQSVQVQDTGSGLASITNVVITNGTVRVPSFSSGTKSAVLVVATKSDPAMPTHWSFDATDKAGHTTHCV